MSRLRGVLAWALIGAGSAAIAYPALAYSTGALRQARLSAAVRTLVGSEPRTTAAGRPESTRPSAPREPRSPLRERKRHSAPSRARYPSEGEALGVVEIPSIGVSDVMLEGVSNQVLLTGPGHLPGTALPGQGVSVVAAHRDAHFRNLKDARIGDVVLLRLPSGQRKYRVASRRIASPTDDWVSRQHDKDVLRLVTCWPPTWVGPAPDRLVVSAVPVRREEAERKPTARPGATRRPDPSRRDPGDTRPEGRELVVSTAGGALFPESSLPLVGTMGAVMAILSAFAASRHRRRLAWWFLTWTGGLGLTALALLAAWAGPMLVHA